ncbi:TonB-dependent receptor domain-containing protein [Rheinheimera sp. UJ63]|uniref:TonB-dependent receptor domain-containing protein n=1 Tax=Rheinheimera sp. UJ63 TaxID=2910157 RepID=UPI001F1FEC25|nr:TonB-dependent receptor [Rheinheimera sp. UJ63]MCF4008061.1 TonB-dependent receptor [Rheinheimera sp. UJ63]
MLAKNYVSKAVSLALTFGAVSASSISAVAIAQDQAAAENKLERIEVTGSRIKRTDLETAQPVLVVSAEDILRSGLTSVGDILKEISTNGASLGLQTNNGNTNGVVRVDLRNCGANRTLVLVNGQRWVANIGGAVDISTIPLAAIKQMEVLKDGASSIYGTDAICGVVNIITNDEFDGAQVSAYNGQYSEGDGKRESYSMTLGSTSAKSSVLLSASYTSQGEVMGGDREISSVPIFGLPARVSASGGRASPTTPNGQFRATKDGVTGSYTLKDGGTGCVPNADCTSLADFKLYDANTDGYNFAPVNYLVQPSETRSLFVLANYDLADNVRLRVDGLYNSRKSAAQLAAQPLGGLAISGENVYNPFGTNITGASFRPIVAPRVFNADNQTWRFGVSLLGDFEFANRNFDWDLGYVYSDNSFTQLKTGFFNSTRMTTALGPSYIDAGGIARCGTAAAPITANNCTPFNIFGGEKGVTPEMLAYVGVEPRNLEFSKMTDYSANIGTELFELPAGAVAAVIGSELRRESGFTNPDPLTVAGQVLGDNAATPTNGGYDVTEFYGEMVIPLLAEMQFAEMLELSASSRFSDYSNFGDTTNSSFKLSYRPVKELLVRASYGEGFRAPSIQELFQGQNDSRPAATDPCSATSVPYQQNADVRSRCAAAGVPAGFVQKDPQFRAKVGGNPDVQPEEAKTKVFGFVYSPEFVENLGVSVDWYNIELQNAIGARSAGYIANACYVTGIQSYCNLITRDFTGTLNANPGEISNVLSLNQNFVGGLEREGVDINVDYRFNTEVGSFRVNWDTAIMLFEGDVGQPEIGQLNADGDISSGNQAGKYAAGASGGGASNKMKSNLSLSWKLNAWSASVTAQYLSGLTEDCRGIITAATGLNQPALRNLCSNPDDTRTLYTFKPGTTEVVATPNQAYATNRLGSVVYFDVQMGWTAPWDTQFTVGVRNLFDKEPPLAFSAFANTYDPTYRLPGRFGYVSLTHKF